MEDIFDKVKEECGVFGLVEPERSNVASSAYFALYALQHRGQESCGIAVNDDGVINAYKDLGLVPDVFKRDVLDSLGKGDMVMGHCRYAVTDAHSRQNCQPLLIRHVKGPLALCTNGALTNAYELRSGYEHEGMTFHGSGDAEIIAATVARKRLTSGSIEKAVLQSMDELKGAYSLLVMSAQKMIAARDPHGFRPLCIGRTKKGGIVFASETCALDAIGATLIRDVEPGEVVCARKVNGEIVLESDRTNCNKCKASLCVFEHVYFARPDSVIDGASVQNARNRAGAFLAKEHPVDADVVIGVPDSGIEAAMGYAKESGIPYGIGFIKNRYIGRSFIAPTQEERDSAVRVKLSAVENTVKGKRVIMIDDSIVRGTTSGRIVKLLREAGATEVHMRVSSPPFIHPCYFGTDIDGRDKLIACRMSIDEIAEYIGVDSLGYLSIDAVRQIAEGSNLTFCDACFTGNYPVAEPAEHPVSKYEFRISDNL